MNKTTPMNGEAQATGGKTQMYQQDNAFTDFCRLCMFNPVKGSEMLR
jgi:hypothetical protein